MLHAGGALSEPKTASGTAEIGLWQSKPFRSIADSAPAGRRGEDEERECRQ